MKPRIHTLLLATTAVASLLTATQLDACSNTKTPFHIRSADGVLRDAQGRELIYHGVNARIEGLFDVSFDDGRTALEPIPPFTEEDCRFIGEDLGMNHLRLLVNWSGIEPHDDDYREDYLARVLEVAAMCERHGVYSLVDFHQDAFSKEIGEDGAPLWAIQPAPTMLLGGPLTDLGDRRASTQVFDAFEGLFSDRYGGATQFADMAAWVAARIDGRPGVIGLELFNEPIVYFDDETLIAFHSRVATRIREVAPKLPVFFEPTGVRNITDTDLASPVFPFSNTVYSPHIYTNVFEDGWANEDASLVQASVAGARVEATAHSAALYVGEFGHDNTTHGALYVTTAMDAMDVNRASWAYWVYEEWSQDSWGLYDAAASGRVALRSARADLMARAYPAAIAGHVESFVYVPATKTLTVTVSAPTSGEHVLAAPERTYPSGVEVRCGGTIVPATVAAGRARFRCAASPIVMTAAP